MSDTKSCKSPQVRLMFLGGVGDDVTGSATLISIDIDGQNRYGLIDVGGYQGEGNRNYYFPVKGDEIDFVIITHAHYDHIGLLPKLYKDGFRGDVYITTQAMVQGNAILKDAANLNYINSEYGRYGGRMILKERNRYENKKKKLTNRKDIKNIDSAISQFDEIIASPLYTKEDVESLKELYKHIKPNELFEIYAGRLYAKLIPTTHQNGAVQIELYVKEDNESLGLVFSGDIGPRNSLLYEYREAEDVNRDIDYGVFESLHGVDAPLETLNDSISKLEKIIKNGIKKGRTVILSGFSLDRNAMLVYLINKMFEKGMRFKAYFDAPLALTELMNYQESYKFEFETRQRGADSSELNDLWFKNLGANPFGLEHFEVVQKLAEHTKLLNTSGPKVIITSSANGNGGRIVDFFEKFIQDENTTFVFCGWIYPGSPSKILEETGSDEIVDFGSRRYKKKCETIRLHGLSSHGGFEEIIDKLYEYPKINNIILNHAELTIKVRVKTSLEVFDFGKAYIPMLYTAYELSKESLKELTKVEIEQVFGKALIETNMNCIQAEIEELMAEDWT